MHNSSTVCRFYILASLHEFFYQLTEVRAWDLKNLRVYIEPIYFTRGKGREHFFPLLGFFVINPFNKIFVSNQLEFESNFITNTSENLKLLRQRDLSLQF